MSYASDSHIGRYFQGPSLNDIENNSSKLNQVKQDIEKIGRKSVAIIGDVSQENDVEKMINYVSEKLGSLNVSIIP